MLTDDKSRCLLIVEDEQDLLDILIETCSVQTLSIEVATNAEEALAVLNKKRIDAVLSDINLPGMSGLDLLSHVRISGNEVPFVFLSGYADQKHLAQALSFGATELLQKPYDEDQLLRHVELSLDLGCALAELNLELKFFSENAMIPAEKLRRVKKSRHELWKLKMQNEIYKIKKNLTI